MAISYTKFNQLDVFIEKCVTKFNVFSDLGKYECIVMDDKNIINIYVLVAIRVMYFG